MMIVKCVDLVLQTTIVQYKSCLIVNYYCVNLFKVTINNCLIYLSHNPIALHNNCGYNKFISKQQSRKEVKQMPAKAKSSNELAVIVRHNLEKLTANTRYPKGNTGELQ